LVAFVRRGDRAAFEVLYERHCQGLLSFCVYMLGSRHDAEDAVQATFASAYRALRADRRPVVLRPWLFTIARNDCLSILRKRRPTVELNGEPALTGDPLRELELREEVRHMIAGLRELPERQRAALVLAELHGLNQSEIGTVLGVEAEQVKAYIYQARSNLISDRRAREADCCEIREELATARGAALLRGRLRRHLRSCADCRVYANGVTRQRRQLGALLPFAPSLMLKYRALEGALGIGAADPATYAGGAALGGAVAGTAAEIAGGGVKALAVKMAAGAALLGASAGVGATVIGVPVTPQEQAPAASVAAQPARSLLASVERASTAGPERSGSALAGRPQGNGRPNQLGVPSSQPSTSPTQRRSLANGGGSETGDSSPGDPGKGVSGKSEEGQPQPQGHAPKIAHPRASEEARQEAQEDQQQSQERQKASEERQQLRKERQKENEERQLERKKKREERPPGGGSRPPRTEEERQKQREEHRPGGGSRPPPTEEQLQRKRERREQRRKEREEQRLEEPKP